MCSRPWSFANSLLFSGKLGFRSHFPFLLEIKSAPLRLCFYERISFPFFPRMPRSLFLLIFFYGDPFLLLLLLRNVFLPLHSLCAVESPVRDSSKMKHHFDQTNIFIESEDKYFIEAKVTTCRFHHCGFEANQFRPLVQKRPFSHSVRTKRLFLAFAQRGKGGSEEGQILAVR